MPAIAHLPTLLSLSLIFTTSYVVANPSRLLAQHVGGQPIAMEHLSPERIDHLGQHDELEAAGYAPHFEPTELKHYVLKNRGGKITGELEANFRKTVPITSIPDSDISVGLNVTDLFAPIELTRPNPDSMYITNPFARENMVRQDGPMQTNKFYTNMYTDTQRQPAYAMPYVLRWVFGEEPYGLIGMTVTQPGEYKNDVSEQIEDNVFGEKEWRAYILKYNKDDIVMGAKELAESLTEVFVQNATHNFAETVMESKIFIDDGTPNNNSQDPIPTVELGTITFPMCQGMGFVTGLYDNLTPEINSAHSIWEFEELAMPREDGPTKKYRIQFRNYAEWLIYVTPLVPGTLDTPSYAFPNLKVVNFTDPVNVNATKWKIQAEDKFWGAIQFAHLKFGVDKEFIYHHDISAGRWCHGIELMAEVRSKVGKYAFDFITHGNTKQELLMYALPHHVESLVSGNRWGPRLRSTVKGLMTGLFGTRWEMEEASLPVDMQLYPWTKSEGKPKFSNYVKQRVHEVAKKELEDEQLRTESDDPSAYWSGKFINTRAHACLSMHEVFGPEHVFSRTCLENLKYAYARYTTNRRRFPLVYDVTWGGIVNTLALNNLAEDYGNIFYNDHHFHYGYMVAAAAIIGHLDPAWLTQGNNVHWVNTLIRDYANPTNYDPWFPQFRHFDWFHGHSWAHGLTEQADGRDQESMSEDYFSTFAQREWARVTGQPLMYARAELILAIQRRINNKYIMVLNNFDEATQAPIHPDQFVETNNLMSIIMEGKIHATTFFGNGRELMHGIHVVPISGITRWMRNPEFVKAEWDRYFDTQEKWDKLDKTWRAIMWMNVALWDPVRAFLRISDRDSNEEENFSHRFDKDHGESVSWYLICLAAWGGDEKTVVAPKNGGGGFGRGWLTQYFNGSKMI